MNLINITILSMIFIVTVLACISIAYLIMRKQIMRVRMQRVLQDSVVQSIGEVGEQAHKASLTTLAAKWLEDIFHRHGKKVVPRELWEKSYLRSQLIMAGFRKDQAPIIYQAARVVLAFLVPSIFLFSQLIAGVHSMRVAIIALALTGVSFYIPTVYLKMKIRKRQKQISKSLPNVLDMLVVCVEAGLGLDAAIQRVGEEMAMASPEVSEEFQITCLELRAGKSRMEALKMLGKRTGVDEVSSLTALLIQTDRFGTSVSIALRSHADGMRIKRRQRLEEQAAKTAVKLIFPLIFFILPALLVVVIGPAFIQIYRVVIPALGGSGG